jgi:very-short-patch-repair endonuclease
MQKVLTQRARQLRKQATKAETILWNRSRAGQFAGFKFRRQQPIDRFVVDFFCASCRLVIELDGLSHEDRAEYDAKRQQYLEAQNLKVLRFHNDEVLHNIDGVFEKIAAACAAPPPLTPPARGGELDACEK